MRAPANRAAGVARPRRRVPRNTVRPNYRRILALFACCVALSGVVSFALTTPDLQVRKVDIAGVSLCDRSAVEAAGRSAVGRNILCLRKAPIVNQIRGFSEVRDVKMGRKFPNGVWIRIWERRPDAVLTDGSSLWLIQQDGLVFHRAATRPPGVPILFVPDCGPVRAGRVCSANRVGYALQVLKCGRDEGLRIDKISVDPQGDICLNMGSDFYVRLGQPDEIAHKMSLLRTALVCKPAIAKEALYIDVSCPSAPVWKPRHAGRDAS